MRRPFGRSVWLMSLVTVGVLNPGFGFGLEEGTGPPAQREIEASGSEEGPGPGLQEARVPEPRSPESIGRAPFPVDLVVALEDENFLLVFAPLEDAIDHYPADEGLRVLRQLALERQNPDRFVARDPYEAMRSASSTAARFESCVQVVLQLFRERALYRGDRDEDASTFRSRLERRIELVEQAFTTFDGQVSEPWASLIYAHLGRFQHTLTESGKEALWDALSTAGNWSRYMRLLALDLDLAPAVRSAAWLQASLEMPDIDQDPLAARLRLKLLEVRSWTLSTRQAVALYVEEAKAFPAGSYEDDFQLAWGRLLAHSFEHRFRIEAIEHLEPLTQGSYRNTTFDATMELGALLRRLGRYDEAMALFHRFQEAHPDHPYQFDRELGRALYHESRYVEAVDAFQRSAEGRRGRGKDYLFIAESMRFLPKVTPDEYDQVRVRREALKLVDFASAAQSEEKRVSGWARGLPDQIVTLQCRFVELVALSRHALLFPMTFTSAGWVTFLELLAAALGLVIFVSFPRLSRRLWYPALVTTSCGLLLPLLSMTLELPRGLGWAGNAAWLGQASVRMFFILAGALILGSVVGRPGMALTRHLRRSLRSGSLGAWVRFSLPVLACAVFLVVLDVVATQHGRVGVSYLERFPTLLAGAELGMVSEGAPPEARVALLLYHVLGSEVLVRGMVVGMVLFLFKGRARGGGLASRITAVLVSALVWAGLTAGSMEPLSLQVGMSLVEGVALGCLRLRNGLDGAFVAHGLARILTSSIV